MEQQPPRKLLDQACPELAEGCATLAPAVQCRCALRLKHYSYRTEQSYVDWIKRYILFHTKRHPKDMGRPSSSPAPKRTESSTG